MAKRQLTPDEVREVIHLKPEDINLDKMKEFFANTSKKKARFNTNDTFTLAEGTLFNKKMQTTIGRYVFNVVMLCPDIIKHTGYVDDVMDGGGIGKLEDKLSQLLLDDEITVKDYIDYINKAQWLGFSCSNFLSATISYDLLVPLKEVEAKKKELEKKYEKEIKAGDPVIATKMETELLEIAKSQIKHLDAYEIYDSGSRGKFGNNYKNTSIMRGAITDNDQPGRFNVSTSNLVDGIPKEDYAAFADMPVQASYSRAVDTQQGGYMAKQIEAAFQTVVLDKQGSDCGTKKTIKALLTAKNKSMYNYRFIKKGTGSPICLDNQTIDKYVGQVVEMYSPMFCINDKICNKCSGDLNHRLGIVNVGLTGKRVGSKIMNLALKKFHDTTLKYSRIDIGKYIE